MEFQLIAIILMLIILAITIQNSKFNYVVDCDIIASSYKVEDIDNLGYYEKRLNCYMYINSACNTYKEPNNTSINISSYSRGRKVKVISNLQTGWCKIDTRYGSEYIQNEYLTPVTDVFIDSGGIMITQEKYDDTIEKEENISDEVLNYAYNYWYLIPEYVRKDFKNNGWKIILTEKSLSSEFNIPYTVSGVTLPKEKQIVVAANQSCIRNALIHEVGHYIDIRNNTISKGEIFKARYNEHGNKMLDYNGSYIQSIYSPEEYFAELYRASIIGSYNMKFMFSDDIKYILQCEKNLIDSKVA